MQIRASDKADRVRSFYLGISRKLWMILQQFPDEKRDRLVLGADGQRFKEVRYSLGELRGEFALEMDLSGMLADNPANRLVQATNNYNLLRADPLINPERLILDLVKAQNKINPEEYLLSLRSPEEELQMMMQGLPVEPHERDDHALHEQKHEVQAALIERSIRQSGMQTQQGQKLRFVLALLLGHQNSHARIVQAMVGQGGRQPGQPIAENAFRAESAQLSGRETEAEMRGQPMV